MPEPRAPSLNDVLGQARAVGTLRAAIASGRVHHAWVFVGPEGVGKRTAALGFAAAILDPSTRPNLAGEWEPDPESPVQRLIAEGRHPDLHVITKELARFSDDKKARERKLITIPKAVVEEHLLGPIARASTLRGSDLARKVFIIDEAELLDRSRTNAPVQNAVLKTLEEPPPGSVIILVTSAEEALLPTIRSRCQRVVFGELPEEAMREWMSKHGGGIAADARAWVLAFARGSPGRALLAIEGGMHEWSRTLEPMLAETERGRCPAGLAPAMAGFIDGWAKGWVEARANASKEAANLAGTRHLLGLVAERERRRLHESAAAGDTARLERSLRAIEMIERAERHVAASVPVASAMDALAAGLAAG